MPINYRTDGTNWCNPAQTFKGNWNVSWGFKSNHTNGVNFVFGDGSVHFITNSINMKTYPSQVTAKVADDEDSEELRVVLIGAAAQ